MPSLFQANHLDALYPLRELFYPPHEKPDHRLFRIDCLGDYQQLPLTFYVVGISYLDKCLRARLARGKKQKSGQSIALTAFLISSNVSFFKISMREINLFVSTTRICDSIA